MKAMLIIFGIGVVAAIVVVAGCRMLASRSTEATVALTAKLPGKIAVVYYSQSKVGNTATVAKWIAKHTGGELVQIETVEAYPDAYGDTLKAAQSDMERGGTRAIKAVPPLDGYDVVFIGSPIAVLHARRRGRGPILRGRAQGVSCRDGQGRPYDSWLEPDRAPLGHWRDDASHGRRRRQLAQRGLLIVFEPQRRCFPGSTAACNRQTKRRRNR